MTPIASSGRYSLLAVVGAGFVVAAPLATWLAVGAVTAPSNERAPLTPDVPSCHSGAMSDVVEHIEAPAPRLDDLLDFSRIVPAFEGGRAVGFKVFSIQPGSLHSNIGLQNGDVILRINGYEVSSPEKGLEVYTKLKDSKQFTIDLKRRGKPQTLDYSITQ